MILLSILACAGRPFLETAPCQEFFGGPTIAECALPGWEDRDYDIVLPRAYDGESPVPLLLALHGGGGNKEGAARVTCPDGDPDDPACLHQHAQDNGYALVLPNGTGFGLRPELRTWNAGGGQGGWRCVSGKACERDIDDVAFFQDLLDDVQGRAAIDPSRVYATGLSNGAAMSHRLACELSDRITAIAAVGGANQLGAVGGANQLAAVGGANQLGAAQGCAPEHPVAVLQIHGTDDPCWQYEGGPPDCPVGGGDDPHIGVEASNAQWAARLGCTGAPSEDALPDTAQDGTTTTRLRWSGCAAPLEHLRVEGGGHTWPDGDPYLPRRVVGRVERDWGNEEIWAFLSAQRREAEGE